MTTACREGLALLTDRPMRMPARLATVVAELRLAEAKAAAAMSTGLGCPVTVRCVDVSRAVSPASDSDIEAGSNGEIQAGKGAYRFSAVAETTATLAETVFGSVVNEKLSRGAADAVLRAVTKAVADGMTGEMTALETGAPCLRATYEASWRRKSDMLTATFDILCRPSLGASLGDAGALDPVGISMEAVIARLNVTLKALRGFAPGERVTLNGGNVEAIEVGPRGAKTTLGRGELGKLNGVRTIRLTA